MGLFEEFGRRSPLLTFGRGTMAERVVTGLLAKEPERSLPPTIGRFEETDREFNGFLDTTGRADIGDCRSWSLAVCVFLEPGLGLNGLLEIPGRFSARVPIDRVAKFTLGLTALPLIRGFLTGIRGDL